jgi:sugar/nucleoside kinase (ribokinase family)
LVAGGVFREIIVGERSNGIAREVRLAGSGLYAALAAARLGTAVTLVAPVGSDDVELVRALCDEVGVRPMLLVSPGASGTFVLERSAGALPWPQYRPAEGVADESSPERVKADVLLAFGHPEWDPSTSPWVTGNAADTTLVWDGQGWLSRAPSVHNATRLPSRRRLHVANSGEVLDDAFAGPEVAMAALPPDGFDATIVKEGPWGVHLISRSGGRVAVAAFDVSVRQTVGSGDVFAGALSAVLAEGGRLEEACETGAAAAAAWISSDASLPGADFADTVRMLRTATRLPTVSPERLREGTAVVSHRDGIGSVILAQTLRRVLDGLGVRTADGVGLPADDVVVELLGHQFMIATADSCDTPDLVRGLERFVAKTLVED